MTPPASIDRATDRQGLVDASVDRLAELIAECGRLAQQDSASAANRLERIAEVALERDLLDLAARAQYTQARAEVARGALHKAIDLIDRSRSLWLEAGAIVSALRTDLGRMHVLDDLGEHHLAIAVGERLVTELDALEPEAIDDEVLWLRAAAHENLGVGRGYIGDHAAALSAYEAAESVYRDLGFDEEVARPRANRGVELIELARFTEAIQTLREAAVMFESTGDHLSTARCLVYEARAQLLSGSYLASAAAIEAAGQLLGGHTGGGDDARMQLVRAETLASLNLNEEALDLYELLVDRLDTGGYRHDRAWALYGSARVLTSLGRSSEGHQRFEEARAIFSDVGDTPMAAMALLGRSAGSSGHEALMAASDACAALETSGRPAELIASYLRLSELSPGPEDAVPYLDLARDVLETHDLPHLRWQIDREQARWHRSAGDLAAARSCLESAAATLDGVRDTVEIEHLRLPFNRSRRGVYEDLIAVLLDLGDTHEAFEVSSQLRARTLVERIAGVVDPAPAFKTTGELDSIYSDLLVAASATAPGLAHRARQLELRATSEPGSSRTKTRTTRAMAHETFDRPTVVFELIGQEVMAFVGDRRGLTATRRLTTVDHVAGLLDRLDAQWRRFDDRSLAVRQRGMLREAALDVLQQLHLALFSDLPRVSEYETLVVVPVGILANIPFGALHDGMCHLVERMPVMLAATPFGPRSSSGGGFGRRLIMGVEDEHAPWIRREVESIAGLAPSSTQLFNEDATAEALAHLAASHDVIHLACHGLDRPDNPAFSALRLGDRWLTAAEVTGLELDGQLVVLSACSSGRQRSGGVPDEPNGLPRAFLAAGAGQVVVNLWGVDDESSATLMTSFHSHLDTLPPTESLRAAQLELLRSRPHPYLWAPSVIYGLHSVRKERA